MALINRNGYIIEKNKLSQEQINKIENELYVEPYIKQDYRLEKNNELIKFKIYKKDDKYYYLPRYWAIDNLNFDIKYNFDITEYDNIDIKFNGLLKFHQIMVVEEIIKIFYDKDNGKLRDIGGGIICIPPGYGKTVIAIFIATFLKLKTLIIVHKTFLLEQWIERITQYSNATIGTIQQEKMDIYKKDIVVGMLQSLNSRDYGDNLESFQFVIFDECHHLGAQVFSKILLKTASPYLLGLSATPERNDKLENVFYAYLGNIIYRMNDKVDQNVKIQIYKFKTQDKKFKTLYNKFTKKYNYAKMVSNLTEIEERNNLIVSVIQKVCNNTTRQLFLLTNRRNHLEILKEKLDPLFPNQVSYYCGGMKKRDLKKSETKQIILGTFEMASEGLDIADLDTLVLATPKSSITQSLGRIMRKNKNDYINNPLIIDIYDDSGIYISMAKKRIMLYKTNYIKENTDITFFNCNDETNFNIIPIYNEIFEKIDINKIDNMFDSDIDTESD
jgi:superfamily II DNA or RNA helicase